MSPQKLGLQGPKKLSPLGVSKIQVAMHSHSHSRHIREIRIQCARKLYVFNSLRHYTDLQEETKEPYNTFDIQFI